MMVDEVTHPDCLINVAKGREETGDVVLSSDVDICLVYHLLIRKLNVCLHKWSKHFMAFEQDVERGNLIVTSKQRESYCTSICFLFLNI